MTSDTASIRHPLAVALLIWPALWLLAWVAGPPVLQSLGWTLPVDGHAHLHAHGHAFADARALPGIPNAMDVLSNLGFLAMAVLLWRSARAAPWPAAWRALALSLALTAAGSAVYHWAPGPLGLLLDRLAMATSFAVVLAMVVAERLSPAQAPRAGVVVLLAGAASAWLAWSQAQVLPWFVLQFGGLLCLAFGAAVRPIASGTPVRWGQVMAWYALAKVFELGDAAVFDATQGLIAGHAVKHLLAAAAVWPIVAAASLRQNAASRAHGSCEA